MPFSKIASHSKLHDLFWGLCGRTTMASVSIFVEAVRMIGHLGREKGNNHQQWRVHPGGKRGNCVVGEKWRRWWDGHRSKRKGRPEDRRRRGPGSSPYASGQLVSVSKNPGLKHFHFNSALASVSGNLPNSSTTPAFPKHLTENLSAWSLLSRLRWN